MKPLSLQLLKKITFFTDLSDNEIKQVADLIRYQRYRKQEVIFVPMTLEALSLF